MNARLINLDEDYATLCSWWVGHGWPEIHRGMLPKLGVMIEHDGKPVAGGFAYLDNSVGVAWMEWLVTDPRNRPTVSLLAIQNLVEALKAAILGLSEGEYHYGVIMTSLRQPSLARLYEKCGFIRTDENVVHMVCVTPKPVEASR